MRERTLTASERAGGPSTPPSFRVQLPFRQWTIPGSRFCQLQASSRRSSHRLGVERIRHPSAFPSLALLQSLTLTIARSQGRKLRTEFKKVLKEGEKERIEREKALKRMRSQRELSEAGGGPPIGTWNRREASAPGGYAASSVGGEEEDYGRLVQGQFSSGMGSRHLSTRDYVPAPESVYSQPQGYSHSPPSDVGTSISARMAKTNSGSGSDVGQRHGAFFSSSRAWSFLTPRCEIAELDLNDPQALEIYSRVLIFKDDSLRDELAFARSLSPAQRRNVHLVAKKLGLEHRSVGAGDDRHVVVFKGGAAPSLVVPEASRVRSPSPPSPPTADDTLATATPP